MTHSRWNSLGRRGLQLAIGMAAASVALAGSPARHSPPAASACPLIGAMTVTAPRLPRRAVLIADLGSMTVTAGPRALVTDLGTMTVTANRQQVVADLGTMTVTATRQEFVARNARPVTARTAL